MYGILVTALNVIWAVKVFAVLVEPGRPYTEEEVEYASGSNSMRSPMTYVRERTS